MTYLYGAIAIVIALLVAAVAVERSEVAEARAERDNAKAALTVAVAANAAQVKTINDLRAENERNDQITLELAETNADLHAAVVANSAELAKLKEGSPNVRSYLDAAVPDELRKLYDVKAASRGQN